MHSIVALMSRRSVFEDHPAIIAPPSPYSLAMAQKAKALGAVFADSPAKNGRNKKDSFVAKESLGKKSLGKSLGNGLGGSVVVGSPLVDDAASQNVLQEKEQHGPDSESSKMPQTCTCGEATTYHAYARVIRMHLYSIFTPPTSEYHMIAI